MEASRDEHQSMPDVVEVCTSITLLEELNLWCDACLLPSAYHGIYMCAVDGQALGVVELRGCIGCDSA